MWRSIFACIFLYPCARDRRQQGRSVAALVHAALLVLVLVLTGAVSSPVRAQDWGSEAEDPWATSTPDRSDPVATLSGWSFRAGLGFTAEPESLLLEFEAPYAFDQWVSVGPMLQVGIDDKDTIVAPSANITVTIPYLPGTSYKRIHPFFYVGLGFAVIEDDDRPNDNTAVGFLIPAGVGIEYQVSDRFAIGSQMTFNFLPEDTLEQEFWYSWQVGGIRISF